MQKRIKMMEEDYKATSRNGHERQDMFDRESNTLDIRSNGMYPSCVLSNLCSNGFRFEGMVCGSMEGFLQSLKYKDLDKQRQICSMKGGNAWKRSVTSWQTDQIVWWKGAAIDRQGPHYQDLVRRAYQAMFDQSERFRAALMDTRGITLVHTTGETNPYKTILTPDELCGILMEIRDKYDRRDKQLSAPPVYTDDAKITLRLQVGKEELALNVPAEAEGKYRRAARQVTDLFELYANKCPTMTTEQMYAAIALHSMLDKTE